MIRPFVAAAALAVAAAAPAAADETRAYAVVFESSDAGNASITRETLTIQNARGHTYVVLANPNGATAGFPATLAPDGEIEDLPNDAALICYNMAISLVAQQAKAPSGPLQLLLAIGGRPTQVPLAIKPQPASPQTLIAAGRLDGVLVQARVDAGAGLVSDATFQEFSFAGVPARLISRSTCALSDVVREAPIKRIIERS